MRVESSTPMKNGGWLHKNDAVVPLYVPPRKAVQEPNLDLVGTWDRWLQATGFREVDGLAMTLGVDADMLRLIGCAWAGREWQTDSEKRAWATPAWAFPMRDERRKLIGIRLRGPGAKWAMKGSRNGLFIPEGQQRDDTLWIVEGPTDASAALTIGLNAIGRPSCSACDDMVVRCVRELKIRRVVIVSDNDQPDKFGVVAGLRGALKLQKALPVPSCIYIPPCKDLREMVNRGGSKEMIEASVKDTVWTVHKAA